MGPRVSPVVVVPVSSVSAPAVTAGQQQKQRIPTTPPGSFRGQTVLGNMQLTPSRMSHIPTDDAVAASVARSPIEPQALRLEEPAQWAVPALPQQQQQQQQQQRRQQHQQHQP